MDEESSIYIDERILGAILYIYPEALVGREDVAVVGEPLAEQIKSEAPWTEASAQETSRLETTLNLKGE